MKKITKQDVENVVDDLFITKYSNLFSKFLQDLSPHTREIIRGNKELNEMFDLFLDFILDSSQHLDYKEAKEKESELSDK